MSRMPVDELSSCHEIVELTTDKYDSDCKISSIKDDINKLFEAIGIGSSCQGVAGLHKSSTKKPTRVAPHVSGIGISEAVSLKQALRRLCISQASELAAMKKRMSRLSEGDGKPNRVEISLVLEHALEHCKNSESARRNEQCEQAESQMMGSDLSKRRYQNFVQRKNLLQNPFVSRPRSPRQGNNDHPMSNATANTVASSSTQDLVLGSKTKQYGSLGWKDFKLLKKIGSGGIAMVYLCELIGTNRLFTMKVRDTDSSETTRARTEKEILEILDHPFLPTLYAHFMMKNFSCLVMEYCPGGDLRTLQQKQPNKRFPESAARFYAAEVLLALEYLHLLGVVFRDVRLDNVLVREDGHIMLSNFDSSLRCGMKPRLLNLSSPVDEPRKRMPSSSCMDPFCLRPLSCLSTGFLSAAARTHSEPSTQAAILVPQLIVEPTNSFVGTPEYLAPEVIKGEDHGTAFDWWTFGIFLYELLFGRTPFRGSNNEETTSNAVAECLGFPQSPVTSRHAEDLIRRLLVKDPENRLGSAAEIKLHPFFEGLNWALIRCQTPPELPQFINHSDCQSSVMIPLGPEHRGDEIEFEMF